MVERPPFVGRKQELKDLSSLLQKKSESLKTGFFVRD